MDNINWSFPLWLTVLCLSPIFVLAIVFAWRAKDFQAGLRLFLLFSSYIVLTISFAWLMTEFVPNSILSFAINFLSSGIIIFICVLGVIYWINTRKAGKLWDNKVDPEINRNKIFGFLYLVLGVSGFLIPYRGMSSTFWMIPIALNLLGRIFLSFQLRERGIVSRGKYIKFEDITSMQWLNLRNKDEVEYTLNDSVRPKRLKIPWNFIIPIDNYIGAHFPRT